ncbi:hypothetical protein OMB55_00017710 [gamma proteobacterium HIMB55]|nr:hypothetical protein OMB55_00017710 [gamma proteobacterium HIMB55]
METLFVLLLGTFNVEDRMGVSSLGSFTSQEACRQEMNARVIYWLDQWNDMSVKKTNADEVSVEHDSGTVAFTVRCQEVEPYR